MDRIISAIAAVALTLLALVAVVYGISTAFANSKAANMNGWVAELVVNARGAFAAGPNGYTNFTTANTAQLVANKLVPKGLIKGGAAVDPWGNNMAFSSANGGSQGVVQFGGGAAMDEGACAKTAMGFSDFVSLKVGTTTFTEASPPDPVTAVAACAQGTTMVLTFQ